MRHKKKVFKIGRRPDHVRALLANQVCSLLFERRIQTTVSKAKEVRRLAEKMITLGKRGQLHHLRRAISKLHQVDAVRILFNDIAPMYANRDGGYTRIIRLGNRRGDAAPICYLELVEEESLRKERKSAPPKKTEVKKEEPEVRAEDAHVSPSLLEEPSEDKTEKAKEIATSSDDLGESGVSKKTSAASKSESKSSPVEEKASESLEEEASTQEPGFSAENSPEKKELAEDSSTALVDAGSIEEVESDPSLKETAKIQGEKKSSPDQQIETDPSHKESSDEEQNQNDPKNK